MENEPTEVNTLVRYLIVNDMCLYIGIGNGSYKPCARHDNKYDFF